MAINVRHDVDISVDVHLWLPEGEARALGVALDNVLGSRDDRLPGDLSKYYNDVSSFRNVLGSALDDVDSALGRPTSSR